MLKSFINSLKQFWQDQKYQSPYVIEDIKYRNNEAYVIYRMRGHAHAIPKKLEEVIFDDAVLSQFKSTEIRTLTFLYIKVCISPSLCLEGQKIDKKTKMFLLRIKSNKSGEIKYINASDFTRDQSNLQQLDKAGIRQANYLAGYNDGYEACNNEKQMLSKKKHMCNKAKDD